MPTGSTTIRINGLMKSFAAPGGGTTVAVDHVNLTVEPGELFFLLGPSGCGKTTLLRMIAGFIDPTEGSLRFADETGDHDVTYVPPNKRNTGMVFQSYALWPHMTVEANVAFGLSIRKVPAAEKKQRVMEALGAVQMEQYAARKPNQLSGGQQQRIALARALVVRPRVLLLDEPLSNLDAKLRNELRSEIRRICKASGITTIYVTHDQKEALSMADRIAIMRSGRVVQIGAPNEMYHRPANRFVAEFLGETNLLPATVQAVHGDSVTLETGAGPLVSRSVSGFSPGAKVLCSLRPESLRLSSSTTALNSLGARLVETTFLGETAQHILELTDGARVKVAELNPGPPRSSSGSSRVEVTPEDVVILSIA